MALQGSILLRKLKTGQTAQVSISTTRQLFQLYTKTEDETTCVPDWSENNVECSVNVVGTGVAVSTVTWYINDTPCTSMSQCTVSSNVLTIKDNLVETLNYISGTLKAVVSLKDASGNDVSVTKTEPIRIQQATTNGYIVMIDANRTWVDGSNNATLTASVYNNMSLQTIGGDLAVKWFAGNASTKSVGETSTLEVSPSMVNGSQLFVCRAYAKDTEVDAEGVTIIDNSDEYHISSDVTMYTSSSDASGSTQENATSVNVGEEYTLAKVAFKVLDKSGNTITASDWKCRKYHADTMKIISGSSSSATYTSDTDTDSYTEENTIIVYDCDYISSSGSGNHQTEVICDAECSVG